jgi:hypothetical protein
MRNRFLASSTNRTNEIGGVVDIVAGGGGQIFLSGWPGAVSSCATAEQAPCPCCMHGRRRGHDFACLNCTGPAPKRARYVWRVGRFACSASSRLCTTVCNRLCSKRLNWVYPELQGLVRGDAPLLQGLPKRRSSHVRWRLPLRTAPATAAAPAPETT